MKTEFEIQDTKTDEVLGKVTIEGKIGAQFMHFYLELLEFMYERRKELAVDKNNCQQKIGTE